MPGGEAGAAVQHGTLQPENVGKLRKDHHLLLVLAAISRGAGRYGRGAAHDRLEGAEALRAVLCVLGEQLDAHVVQRTAHPLLGQHSSA